MITVLLAYASKHGSTREIVEAIGRELEATGLTTDVRDVADVRSLDDVDAVVAGSAIYVGQWQPAAVRFIDQHVERLKQLPVWLFSSGPIGVDPFPKEDPPATAELVEKAGAREYRRFAGKLDRRRLGFGERLVSRVVRAPEGDFRQWQEIREWAREIAAELNEAQGGEWNGFIQGGQRHHDEATG